MTNQTGNRRTGKAYANMIQLAISLKKGKKCAIFTQDPEKFKEEFELITKIKIELVTSEHEGDRPLMYVVKLINNFFNMNATQFKDQTRAAVAAHLEKTKTTQRQFAVNAGVDWSNFSKWLKGKYEFSDKKIDEIIKELKR